jgi:hypothetical protein
MPNVSDAPELTVQIDVSDGLAEEEATCFGEAAFNQTMDEKMMCRPDTLTFDDQQITTHYTGGYD